MSGEVAMGALDQRLDALRMNRILNRSMTLQLGGSISCDWSAEGVIVTLHMAKDWLAR